MCALLETFFAGQGMGRAVAEILFASVTCGKLTVTVPNTLEETPAWLNYPGYNLRHHYGEGLFVGYRCHGETPNDGCCSAGLCLQLRWFTVTARPNFPAFSRGA